MEKVPKDKLLILFDGVCNLCNNSVQYVIKHDKKNKFLFAPLQSEVGESIIEEFSIDSKRTDSILLYNPEAKSIKIKSSAAIGVAKHLGFPLTLMVIFYIVPNFIRNWVYDYIAKNRYKWYGRKEECMIPTPELKSKFLT
ncbi:thiol-disulfide oxidoreductase DCC family protein [Winogradskyella sp.]|uniref:thiol-disulfide oxidoreductase DCC family protein n=1 Tax=Winogradskyella sp. TaxID=1883156 RepID=UPI0035179F88